MWIEIFVVPLHYNFYGSRPLHRGCGLKSNWFITTIFTVIVALFTEGVDWNSLILCILLYQTCRPLHRGCGLKFFSTRHTFGAIRSPSSQRVWIEIYCYWLCWHAYYCRPLHRGCGLKSKPNVRLELSDIVALFTEGVDWNNTVFNISRQVASRPLHRGCGLKSAFLQMLSDFSVSPSSQRVWIEIQNFKKWGVFFACRPLHRGCGLKLHFVTHSIKILLSPSSQRVWIEIWPFLLKVLIYLVALFTEGVDWNHMLLVLQGRYLRRPLHRGCGLKYALTSSSSAVASSPSSQRVWIEIFLFIFAIDFFKSRPLHRGCGLKYVNTTNISSKRMSPSSQRVWIEIDTAIYTIT